MESELVSLFLFQNKLIKKNMNKSIFKILALTMFLVVFPLISYLYLKRGVEFRKEVIKDLESKRPISFEMRSTDSIKIDYKAKCTLVELNTDGKNASQIFDQFKDAIGFQFLSVNEFKAYHSFKRIDSSSYKNLINSDPGVNFMLIDSLGNVRKSYQDDPEQLKRMVIHITALLPYYNEKKGR